MSLITGLPAILDQFSETCQKGFPTVTDLKERGIPLVGAYCTFIPQEILMVVGAVAASLCSTSNKAIEEAEKDLSRNLCPLVKSSYGFDKTSKCPYSYFSDLVADETTCDGKKKMCEYMAESKPVRVMQLPNSVKDDASRTLWKAEMLCLQKTIEERFGHGISEDALRDAVAPKSRGRRVLANFYRFGRLNPPALSGSDILRVVYSITLWFDKEALINELDAMTTRVRQQWGEGQWLALRPHTLVTDCPIGGAAGKVVRVTEENDDWVVGYENYAGTKATGQCVTETGGVHDALADKYLAIGCSCVSPNDQRLQTLSQMVEEYQIDDVADVILQARHTYAVESLAIECHVRQQHNVPHIVTETDYSTLSAGQLSTRAATFIETLRGAAVTCSIGTDSGSTTTKGILLADGVVTRRFLVLTLFHSATAITEAWRILCEGLEAAPLLTFIGYGRRLADLAGKQVTKVSCHGLGTQFLASVTRAVIDIDGQDSKVIQLDDDGSLCDFLINDKCTADTGRFLEVISCMLGTSAEQFDNITEDVTPYAITSMHIVFTESEVTSLYSADVAPGVTLAGVANATTRKSANFVVRLSCKAPILFTGGVSHCQIFVRMLESHLGMPVNTHLDAQSTGAIGAVVIGQ